MRQEEKERCNSEKRWRTAIARPQIEDGHTKIANELIEALAKVNLSAYESRVLWCIFRKTYGWNKKMDRISYTQFEEVTGMAHQHVGRTLKLLLARNMIICQGDRQKLEWGIQKDYEQWRDIGRKELKPVPKEVLVSEIEDLASTSTQRGTSDLSFNQYPTGTKPVPNGDDLVPKEVLKPVPKEVHTKAIKHLTKALTKAIPIIPEWINKEIWDDFLKMRQKMKAPPTEYAKTLLIKELEKFKLLGDDPNLILNQSIMNNWKGIFPLKEKNNGIYKGNPSQKPAGAFSDLDNKGD